MNPIEIVIIAKLSKLLSCDAAKNTNKEANTKLTPCNSKKFKQISEENKHPPKNQHGKKCFFVVHFQTGFCGI